MSAGDSLFEKSRSIEDVQHLRLMVLLEELVEERGIMKAAESLNVDHRTLNAGLETKRLSRRLRGALEKRLLEGGGSPAREQRARNDELAGRLVEMEKGMEDLGGEIRDGLGAVHREVEALREEQARDRQRLADLEKARDGQDADGDAGVAGSQAPGDADTDGEPQSRATRRREFPELATLEPAVDDEEVFGAAWPLVAEWRELKETHPRGAGGKGLDWLLAEERVLEVELALLEGHGLTLPPETYPLKGLDRGVQVNWRRKALDDTRRARRRRELLLWLPRALRLGRWLGRLRWRK